MRSALTPNYSAPPLKANLSHHLQLPQWTAMRSILFLTDLACCSGLRPAPYTHAPLHPSHTPLHPTAVAPRGYLIQPPLTLRKRSMNSTGAKLLNDSWSRASSYDVQSMTMCGWKPGNWGYVM